MSCQVMIAPPRFSVLKRVQAGVSPAYRHLPVPVSYLEKKIVFLTLDTLHPNLTVRKHHAGKPAGQGLEPARVSVGLAIDNFPHRQSQSGRALVNDAGQPHFWTRPVTITRFEPKERTY